MLGPLTAFSGGVLTGIPSRHSRSEHPPGLTELEAAVLDELLAVNEATEPVLGEQMGIASAALSRALGRLVELNYVIGVVEHGQTLYRPSERPLAART
jgi:hypothetical protein